VRSTIWHRSPNWFTSNLMASFMRNREDYDPSRNSRAEDLTDKRHVDRNFKRPNSRPI
jgi:hypothetical protein